jgi:hypothetical protein
MDGTAEQSSNDAWNMNAGCKALEFLVQHQQDYYFDMRALSTALIRKSSQNAGCIFLSPASHCCHARHVE